MVEGVRGRLAVDGDSKADSRKPTKAESREPKAEEQPLRVGRATQADNKLASTRRAALRAPGTLGAAHHRIPANRARRCRSFRACAVAPGDCSWEEEDRG